MYRELLRATGRLKEGGQRAETRAHIRAEFEQWRNVTDEVKCLAKPVLNNVVVCTGRCEVVVDSRKAKSERTAVKYSYVKLKLIIFIWNLCIVGVIIDLWCIFQVGNVGRTTIKYSYAKLNS